MAARRLPVLQDAGEPQRPTWQWLLIGAGLVFTMWLPLAVVAAWLAPRTAALAGEARWLATLLGAAPSVLSLLLAALFGGAVITHFGSAIGGRRAALSGLLAALTAWFIAWASGALRPWPVAAVSGVLLGSLGAGGSALGSVWARRRARRRIKQADPAIRKM